MKKFLILLLLPLILFDLSSCRKKPEANKIDIDQIDTDSSINYRYLFREEIEKEAKEKRKKERSTFK